MDATTDTPVEGYRESLDFLYSRINYERTPTGPRKSSLNLARMRTLLARLGNPQDVLSIVHLAGTKGKGSTSAMLSSVLIASGYRTGLYTSPHLERLEERVRIDGVPCLPRELVDLVRAVRPVVAAMDAEVESGRSGPTFFEITTAMALLHFARAGTDAVVLEVGLGGRLDSTNVCIPAITVITSISFDHTRQLGATLAAIAFEKAGIIKPKVPVICGVLQDEPKQVIKQTAAQRNAPCYFLGEDFEFEYRPPQAVELLENGKGRLDFRGRFARSQQLEDIQLGLLGRHQAANAAVAVAALEQLHLGGWTISEAALRQGLTDASCPGRIEILGRQPTIVLDTAHNVASIEALAQTLEESFVSRRRILIFAATQEKDVHGMLRHLLPRFDSIILTRYVDNPRGVPPADLEKMIVQIAASEQLHSVPQLRIRETPAEAWRECQSVTTPEHLVCITGSFFLAAEMRSLILAARAETRQLV